MAAEPLVPKAASLQFAAALSEAAIASFAAPTIAAQLERVPWGGGRWRYKPEPPAQKLTYSDALGEEFNWMAEGDEVSLAYRENLLWAGGLRALAEMHPLCQLAGGCAAARPAARQCSSHTGV